MRHHLILIFLILSLSIISCKPVDVGPSGVTVSEWYYDKKYEKNVIDLINFDKIERKIKVTSLCFDETNQTIPSNDSATLTIPPNSKWTWVPICPPESKYHTISFGNAE